jgi:phage gp36-like protein
MSDTPIFTRDTLLAAAINGVTAYLAVRYLVPSEGAMPWLSMHSITVALVMAAVSILSDQIYPRVNSFLASHSL